MHITLSSPVSVVRPANEHESLEVFGVRVRLLVDGEASGGAFSMAHIECAPGSGAPPHRHAEKERFYVLTGQVVLLLDGIERRIVPGDFAEVAPGAAHGFRNDGASPAELINVGTPAGHDRFFRAADALARAGRFTPENALRVCQEHGIELVR